MGRPSKYTPETRANIDRYLLANPDESISASATATGMSVSEVRARKRVLGLSTARKPKYAKPKPAQVAPALRSTYLTDLKLRQGGISAPSVAAPTPTWTELRELGRTVAARDRERHVDALAALVGDGSFLDFLRLRGVTLSPVQRVLCAVVFDGVTWQDLDAPDLTIYDQLFGVTESGQHVEYHDASIPWHVWVVGARSGKSYLLSLGLLWKALTCDLGSIAAGEQAYGLLVCPDLRLSRHALAYVTGVIDANAALHELVSRKTQELVTLLRPDGKLVTIETLPATKGGSAVRGRTLFGAVLDEVAFFRDDSYVVNDQDIFDAVSPRVTIPGGFLVLSSTPYVESGLLWTMYRDNWSHPVTALCAHATTEQMRSDSHIIMASVAKERKLNEKNAQREFDAVFGATSSGLFFDQDSCRAAIRSGSDVLPIQDGARITIAVDAAFSTDTDDLFGWAVATSLASPLVSLADIKRDRRLTTVHRCGGWLVDRSPRDMAIRLRDEVCRPLSTTRIFIDQFSDRAFAQLCADVGLTADTLVWHGGDNENSKSERYRRVRTALQNGDLVLCDSDQLRKDMLMCRAKPLPGGGEQISVPRTRRGHGDVLSAVVAAASEAMSLPSLLVEQVAPDVAARRAQDAYERKLRRDAERRARERRAGSWLVA